MKVSEIINNAIKLMEIEIPNTDEDSNKLKNILVKCFNVVLSELSMCYFPIKTKEKMQSKIGEYYFKDFAYPPYKIIDVKSNNHKIKWELKSTHISCMNSEIDVEYEYYPKSLNYEDEFIYPNTELTTDIIELGIVAEYYLLIGYIKSAELWEEKYRNKIEEIYNDR